MAGNNVVGVVAGRNILFPRDSDTETVIKELRNAINHVKAGKNTSTS